MKFTSYSMLSNLAVLHVLIILSGSIGSVKEVEAQQRLFFFNKIKQFFAIHFPFGGPISATLLPWPNQEPAASFTSEPISTTPVPSPSIDEPQQEPADSTVIVDGIVVISKWDTKMRKLDQI